ncbi:putative RPGR [Besnoitia besnoiti]|uniref:Putative RPGR n=1 Tax=Besnoitia besnoiti TaxID=94643 RepID=A0A2A9MB28_BESBE|nr:putative RPGR [Besnoitia besnoiti]PFH34404.1 putative RPGR [Besnoitia besnoiti]
MTGLFSKTGRVRLGLVQSFGSTPAVAAAFLCVCVLLSGYFPLTHDSGASTSLFVAASTGDHGSQEQNPVLAAEDWNNEEPEQAAAPEATDVERVTRSPASSPRRQRFLTENRLRTLMMTISLTVLVACSAGLITLIASIPPLPGPVTPQGTSDELQELDNLLKQEQNPDAPTPDTHESEEEGTVEEETEQDGPSGDAGVVDEGEGEDEEPLEEKVRYRRDATLITHPHLSPSDAQKRCNSRYSDMDVEGTHDLATAPPPPPPSPEPETETPEDQAETPEDQAEAPEDQAEAPEDQAEAPEGQAEAPEDQAEAE